VLPLDALRGLAVLAVLAFHYSVRLPIEYPAVSPLPWALPWGEDGVQLFFAISGYVILMTLDRTAGARAFVWARFLRLFPSYWAGLLFTSLIVLLIGDGHFAMGLMPWLANWTMLQSWAGLPSVDGVYWSLAVELCFYGLMLMLWKAGLHRHLPLILVAWLPAHLLWAVNPALSWKMGHVLLAEQLPWFAIGMAAWFHRKGQLSPMLALLLGGYAVAIAAAADPRALWVGGVIGGLFVLLEAGGLNWLAVRPLLWVGGISYPLYLVHQYAGFVLIDRLVALGCGTGLAVALVTAAMLLVAWAIARGIEKPCLTRWRTPPAWRLFNRRGVPA